VAFGARVIDAGFGAAVVVAGALAVGRFNAT
jgi:hypothetical protein